jgi:hypothetical protein
VSEIGQTECECECLACGRLHRRLGQPPWALSHDDACRLSRVFGESVRVNLQIGSQDYQINERLIANAENAREQSCAG